MHPGRAREKSEATAHGTHVLAMQMPPGICRARRACARPAAWHRRQQVPKAPRASEQPGQGGNQRGDAHKGRPPRGGGHGRARAPLPRPPAPPCQKTLAKWDPVVLQSLGARGRRPMPSGGVPPPPSLSLALAKPRAGGGICRSPALPLSRTCPFPCSFEH